MTVHATPPHGEATTPCCDATPFELPTTDRMTLDAAAVTCTITDHSNAAGAVGSGVQQAGTAMDCPVVAAAEDTDSPSSPPRPTTHTNGSTK